VNGLFEKGFSLIEFMIAITISMIILLAVSIAWQSSLVTQKTQTDASRLNETVRFSIDLLSREIKQAGLINTTNASVNENPFSSSGPAGGAIAGINDPATIDPVTAGATIITPGTTTILNLSDAIRVRYYGEDATAGQMGGNGSGTEPTYDCLGNPVPAATLVEDTLYVAADPNNNNEPSLWCHTSNPPPAGVAASQPMVAGVESLQILYGEDLPDPITGLYDGIINHYVPWQLVINPDYVLSVKVSVVARSANAVSLTPSKTYQHFGQYSSGPPIPTSATANNDAGTTFTPNPPDKRLRLPQPLSTEIARRNF
jgi:type IV pilus assembly protein PilW